MASNKPESWGFQSLAGLLRDLGPTEGQRKVYKRFKELYQSATRMSAHHVTKKLERGADAVSAPDCSKCDPREKGDPNQKEYNWEPDHLIRAYHTTTSSPKAIALVEENSPENDLLLLPSTGGWEAAMGVIRS